MLTPAELQLATDASFIYRKNSVIDKAIMLFGEIAENYKESAKSLTAQWPQIFGPHPKISKGEKHQDLPWVMLDYPRLFDKEKGHLAIRTFFWWGNYFSIHLQVSAGYMPLFLKVLPTWLETQMEDWFVGLTDDAWDMTLPNLTWIPLSPTEGAHCSTAENDTVVLKLAKKIPIEQWESVQIKLSEYFSNLMILVSRALAA